MRNRPELDGDEARGSERRQSRQGLRKKQEKLAAWEKQSKEFLNGIVISILSLSATVLTDNLPHKDPHRERQPLPSQTTNLSTMMTKARKQSQSGGSRTQEQSTDQSRARRSQITTGDSKKRRLLNRPVEALFSDGDDQFTSQLSPPEPPITPAASSQSRHQHHSISRPDWVDKYSKNPTPGKKSRNFQSSSDPEDMSEETSDEESDSGSEESVNPITPASSQRRSTGHRRSLSTPRGVLKNGKDTDGRLVTSRHTQRAKSHGAESASLPGTSTHSLQGGEQDSNLNSQQSSRDGNDTRSLPERMGKKNNPAKSRAIRLFPPDAIPAAKCLRILIKFLSRLGSEISKVVYPTLGNLDRPITSYSKESVGDAVIDAYR